MEEFTSALTHASVHVKIRHIQNTTQFPLYMRIGKQSGALGNMLEIHLNAQCGVAGRIAGLIMGIIWSQV